MIVFVDTATLTAEDQMTFVSAAHTVLHSGVHSITTDRGPGYPLFLAAIYGLFGAGNSFVLGVQAIVDSFTCVVVGLLAQRILGQGLIIAGLISACNLNMIILSSMVLTDSLFLCFFALFLLFQFRYVVACGSWDHFLFISFLALATVVRPVSYYLIPCVLLGSAVWSIRIGLPRRRVAVNFLTGIALVALLLGPQHMRNWEKYGAYEYVSQNGATLLGWTVPGAFQYSGQGTYQEGQALAQANLSRALARDGLQSLPENPFSASRYEAAVAKETLVQMGGANLLKAWIVGAVVNLIAPSAAFAPIVRAMDHPSFYETSGTGGLEKIVNYIGDLRGVRYVFVLGFGSMASLLFLLGAMSGWWTLIRSRNSAYGKHSGTLAAILIGLVAVYFLLVTGPIIGPKYRLPIEPMMTVLLVAAVCRWPRKREISIGGNSRLNSSRS